MAKGKKIAFQGVPGAYSHLASSAVMPDAETIACSSFSEMILAVQKGDADFAMVPVENSTAGRVADIHHILQNQDYILSVSIISQLITSC